MAIANREREIFRKDKQIYTIQESNIFFNTNLFTAK